MHNIRLAACLALSRPCRSEHDTAAVQPLGETFSDFREKFALGIIPYVCQAPVECEMGHQGKADQFCKFDRLDNVGSADRNVFGAATR